jgi:hypothetical protein
MQEQTEAKWTHKKKKRLEKYIVSSGPPLSEILLTFHGTVGEEVEEGRAGGDIRETQVCLPFFPFVKMCSPMRPQAEPSCF